MSLTKPMTFTVVAIDSRGDVDVAMATIEPVGKWLKVQPGLVCYM